ncbi:MAG: ACT domain-containing protein [Flavobacteriaceae bacterium]|nr:ACT domain-containing protein [Flavobacteriaceae bacterium]
MLDQLKPSLQPRTYVYVCMTAPVEFPDALAMFWEAEGITYVLPKELAVQKGLNYTFEAAWIQLDMPTDLYAVGITAAVSGALAKAGIPCNMIAAYHHDHLFVPKAMGQKAIEVLKGKNNSS